MNPEDIAKSTDMVIGLLLAMCFLVICAVFFIGAIYMLLNFYHNV